MNTSATAVDPTSTPPTPLESRIDDQRETGRGNTAEHNDKVAGAIKKLHTFVVENQREYQLANARCASIEKMLKPLRIKPLLPVPFAELPLKRDLIEKACGVLKKRKLKVKDFRREMGYFEETEMTRDRALLEAAGVTVETVEGSAVFISLSEEFASGDEG